MLSKRTKKPNYAAAPATREHHEERAAEIVTQGLALLGMSQEDLGVLPRGEERKVLIALAVKQQTTVPLDWIAQRLEMGARSTVSREIGAMARRLPKNPRWRKLIARITEKS
jgi:ABC-type cobalamin/Fe3+-siderophores transport system ATPase subunit